MGVATAIAVGAVIAGSVASNQAAQRGAKAQINAAKRNADAFGNIPIPSIEDQKIILQNPNLVGQYTPEQQQAMTLNVSEMSGVKADQGTVNAQNQALQGIGQVAQGGFTEGDKAAAREVERTVSQDAQARKNAILNSMAQRGTLGSGMELAAQLQGNQQSANQMSSAGDALTQQAQARALQALGQQGSLAGQMRSQDVGEKTNIARAQDAINQFNTQNRQNVANINTANANQAQQYNLNNAQNLENQRAANANTAETHNKGLYQTQFANQMGKTAGETNANTQLGNAQANSANDTAKMYAGIGQGIATAGTGYAANEAATLAQNKNLNAKYNTNYDTGE